MAFDVNTGLKILYELFRLLNKDKIEKFEKEWKKDEKKIIKALREGNADSINFIIAKYSNL